MGPHLKAFVAVFVISAMSLIFVRAGFASSIGRSRATHWAFVWLGMTSAAFILTNYWIFVAGSAALVFALSRAEPIKPAIYLLLMPVAPTLGESIPGIAGINKLIQINPQLVVLLFTLAPAMFAATRMKRLNKVGRNADLFFLLFLILQIALSIRAPSFTHMVRTAIEQFLLIAPIYYVFSRYPKSFGDFRILSAALVFPVIVLAATSIPEFLRNWHFYNSVSTNWFGQMPFGYSMREGYLRATASVFNPIVWGYVAMCAIGIGLAVLNDRLGKIYRLGAFVLLGAGLIVSLSRGPWIGAIATIMVYILLSPRMISRATQTGAAALAAFVISLATPFGRDIVDLLPFVGERADSTISYRQQLLEQAWVVMLENPIFGTGEFLEHSALQSMRQGQGIIDIVNSYLQVGLKSGFVGLTLFLAFFTCVISSLLKAHKNIKTLSPIIGNYCRAYLATLVGVLLTIFTTSSEGQIPYLYWSIGALGVALSRIVEHTVHQPTMPHPIETPLATTKAFEWK